MALLEEDNERAGFYRILADIFSAAPKQDKLHSILEDFELESKDTAEEVLGDFNSLFLYPEGKLPPLESLYTEGEDIADTVAAFYYGTGLTFEEDYETVADHISIEFLFMSYLIDIDNHELQQKFLEEHISNWVPYYCEQVMKQARTVFYREITEITKGFIEHEYEGSG